MQLISIFTLNYSLPYTSIINIKIKRYTYPFFKLYFSPNKFWLFCHQFYLNNSSNIFKTVFLMIFLYTQPLYNLYTKLYFYSSKNIHKNYMFSFLGSISNHTCTIKVYTKCFFDPRKNY